MKKKHIYTNTQIKYLKEEREEEKKREKIAQKSHTPRPPLITYQ